MNKEAKEKVRKEIENFTNHIRMEDRKKEWENFYKEFFNIKVDFSSLNIKIPLEGEYLLVISKEISLEDVFFVLEVFYQNRTSCLISENISLDEVILSKRNNKEDYFFIVPKRQNNKNNIIFTKMTLLEAMIFQLKHPMDNAFWENIIVCFGSSYNRDELFIPVVYSFFEAGIMFAVDLYPLQTLKEIKAR